MLQSTRRSFLSSLHPFSSSISSSSSSSLFARCPFSSSLSSSSSSSSSHLASSCLSSPSSSSSSFPRTFVSRSVSPSGLFTPSSSPATTKPSISPAAHQPPNKEMILSPTSHILNFLATGPKSRHQIHLHLDSFRVLRNRSHLTLLLHNLQRSERVWAKPASAFVARLTQEQRVREAALKRQGRDADIKAPTIHVDVVDESSGVVRSAEKPALHPNELDQEHGWLYVSREWADPAYKLRGEEIRKKLREKKARKLQEIMKNA